MLGTFGCAGLGVLGLRRAPSRLIEGVLDGRGQLAEQAVTASPVRGAVHDGERFRLKLGQRTQHAIGLARSLAELQPETLARRVGSIRSDEVSASTLPK